MKGGIRLHLIRVIAGGGYAHAGGDYGMPVERRLDIDFDIASNPKIDGLGQPSERVRCRSDPFGHRHTNT